MRDDWIVPDGWDLHVYFALERFLTRTGLHKEALARALGIHPSSLTLSHLQNPEKRRYIYQRLPYALRRERFFEIAAALRLDYGGCQALKELVGEILSINFGFQIDPAGLVANRTEAVELGMLGVAFFDEADWLRALSHLQYAWSLLAQEAPGPEAPSFAALLRVGTQLISWQSLAGQIDEIQSTAKRLLQLARTYHGSDPTVLEAISLLYKGVGTGLRHAGQHPEYVVEKFQIAERICAEQRFPRRHRIAALHDQAKPFVRWGKKEEALGRLEHAEVLAGGHTPDEEVREDWLFTRFTAIECLAALGDKEAAYRLWQETMEQDFVPALLQERSTTPLPAKKTFAEIAVAVAAQDFDQVAATAQAFRQTLSNAIYGERRQRAAEIIRLALAGDQAALQRLLIR